MFGVHRILLLIPSNRRSNFFFFCSTKDKSSGSNSNNGSVINANTIFIPQDLVHQESSGQAWGITKSINQFSLSEKFTLNLVSFDLSGLAEIEIPLSEYSISVL